MEEKKVCMVCGTPLVKANKELKLDGSLNLDGSWTKDNKDNMICPKCHPELAESAESE